ncbi:hypothetical protein [uncultured Corynebacterium sp.]|uniref:hypothetical protein n=1 Tax=uncultured Corynebacterium sp. TaxID=159447 RepID=UPI0025E6229F|nr:hypothetical protein [uncultured Corynebacterium sp.]
MVLQIFGSTAQLKKDKSMHLKTAKLALSAALATTIGISTTPIANAEEPTTTKTATPTATTTKTGAPSK